MSGRSRREHVLMITACLVAVAIGYWLFRMRPTGAAIERLNQQAAKAETELKDLQWPQEPPKSPAELEQELAQLKTKQEQRQKKLEELKEQLVPIERPEAVQKLKVAVSDLATRCGVRIQQSEPYTFESRSRSRAKDSGESGDATAEAEPVRVDPVTWNHEYNRPLQRFQARCSFYGLLAFIESLKELPWLVVVVHFDVETAARSDQIAGRAPLKANLILGY